jgi:hypothetical protein
MEMEVAPYPTPQELFKDFLSRIPCQQSIQRAIQQAEWALELSNKKEESPLYVINALLKRMISFCPESATYIDCERHKPDPNSPYPSGKTGPTPEILLNAIKTYAPQELKMYRDFIQKFFIASTQQFSTLLAKVEEEAKLFAYINDWIGDVQKARQNVVKEKAKRLMTPNQLRQWWLTSGARKPNKPWKP